MRLHEIISNGAIDPKIPSFNLKYDSQDPKENNAKIIPNAIIGGYQLYYSGVLGVDKPIFCLEDTNVITDDGFPLVIAFIIFNSKTEVIGNTEYSQIDRIYSHPDYRGRGLVTGIFDYLNLDRDIKIKSDMSYTTDGLKHLRGLVHSGKYKTKFYNEKTGEITTAEPENLFDGNNRWFVLFEQSMLMNKRTI